MKPRDKKKPKTLLLTTFAAAGALGYMFLVFVPGQRVISSIRTELRQKQEAVIEADRLSSEILKTEELLKQALEFKSQWQKNAPDQNKVANAFATVTSYAKQANVRVLRFEPQPAVQLNTLTQVPVTMVVEGDFAEIYELLRQLDESTVPIWANEANFQTRRESGKDLQCQISLTIFADNRGKSG